MSIKILIDQYYFISGYFRTSNQITNNFPYKYVDVYSCIWPTEMDGSIGLW